MSQLYGVDVSYFQGNINWDELNAASNFVIMRSSYGTITDPLFSRNQAEARRVRASAGPLGIGYYYFAYPTLLDPVTSANYFVDNIGGLEDGEVLALDLEGNIGPNPVGWSLQFLQHCEQKCGVKPLVYLNQSEMNGYNWAPVINNGNGLWLAKYDNSKTNMPGPSPWPVVAMRQWTDADSVAGISGKVDGDVFYGDFPAFYAYGYKKSSPAPATPPVEPTLPPAQPEPPETPPVEAEPVQIPVQTTTTPPVDSVQGPSPDVTPPVSEELPVSDPGSSKSPSVISVFVNSTLGRAWLGLMVSLITPLIMYLQKFQTSSATLALVILLAVTVLQALRDLANNRLPNLPKLR